MIGPGKTIGILGGGQLGRMTGQAARELGYGFVVFEPGGQCPAGQVADREINADYADEDALARFADSVDVVTYEFENVNVSALDSLKERVPVYPNPNVLRICQNREREKTFLRESGFPHAPFAVIESASDLENALRTIGKPSVLKTADFGYDGKGQLKIDAQSTESAADIWSRFDGDRAVLEGWMEFDLEISVIVAISSSGEVSAFPVAENIHTNHILDFSIVPARMSEAIAEEAVKLATAIAQKLDVIGLIGVELFVLKDGSLAVNEMAPRPHNSGHYTMDACHTSQFEQFVRAVCGLPLGSPQLDRSVAMVNILGDAWQGKEPDFAALLQQGAKLHLYGKAEPRVGRKMGHFNVLGESAEDAFATAKRIKAAL
ncbi:MAG: 5-(carboxyamino)imidazole ribonucleotide synthase [Opitutales bacterium TMED158]|nr:MAG: 5-(carboxyamino)imidazole ribonucleotide synthase [Opitutales bacterium TMED158]